MYDWNNTKRFVSICMSMNHIWNCHSKSPLTVSVFSEVTWLNPGDSWELSAKNEWSIFQSECTGTQILSNLRYLLGNGSYYRIWNKMKRYFSTNIHNKTNETKTMVESKNNYYIGLHPPHPPKHTSTATLSLSK